MTSKDASVFGVEKGRGRVAWVQKGSRDWIVESLEGYSKNYFDFTLRVQGSPGRGLNCTNESSNWEVFMGPDTWSHPTARQAWFWSSEVREGAGSHILSAWLVINCSTVAWEISPKLSCWTHIYYATVSMGQVSGRGFDASSAITTGYNQGVSGCVRSCLSLPPSAGGSNWPAATAVCFRRKPSPGPACEWEQRTWDRVSRSKSKQKIACSKDLRCPGTSAVRKKETGTTGAGGCIDHTLF